MVHAIAPMPQPRVLYEDGELLVVEKPAGILVHGAHSAKRETHGADAPRSTFHTPREWTLVDWLLKRYPEVRTVGDDPATRPGIVHRLDRDTSGVMVVARTQEAFDRLKELFRERKVQKMYQALVIGNVVPRRGVVDLPIGLVGGTTRRSVHTEKLQKAAVTRYRAVHYFTDRNGQAFSLLEVRPETGRTHQIRVHLASIGHPVVGDRLYGKWKSVPWVGRLMLHAAVIEFSLEAGKRLRFEAPPPADFRRSLAELRPWGGG